MLSIEPALPVGLTSENIAHVFGAQTSAFELFIMKRKIMGPCWLRVEKPEKVSSDIVSSPLTADLPLLILHITVTGLVVQN